MQLINGVPQKNLEAKNQNFLTSAPRFQQDSAKKDQGLPGPGHYAAEANATTWFKRSYNMNFSEM